MEQSTVNDTGVAAAQHECVPAHTAMAVINHNVFHDVHYPSPQAAQLAQDAWRAAQRYYDLFFTCMNDEQRTNDGGGTSAPTLPPTARSRSGNGLDHLGDDSVGSRSSSSSQHQQQRHSMLYNSSSYITGNTPNHVLNTNYHTFFPPVLSAVHRQRILETILGRPPLPWQHWRWHSSKEYHTLLHTQCATSNTNAAKHDNRTRPAEGHHNDDGDGSPLHMRGGVRSSSSRAGSVEASRAPPHHRSAVAGAFSFPLSNSDRTYTSVTPRTHTSAVVAAPVPPLQPSQAADASAAQRTTGHHEHPADASTSSLTAGQSGGAAGSATSRSADALSEHHDPATYILPTSLNGPEYFHATAEDGTKTLIIIMVGLPARGKTFLAQKICRLLNWHGSRAKVQNLQVTWRRLLLGSTETTSTNDIASTNRNDRDHNHSSSSEGAHGGQSSMRSTKREFPSLQTHAMNVPSSTAAQEGASLREWQRMPLTTAHFRGLLLHPQSEARRRYNDVLDHVVRDCQDFFAHAGEVVVINDDFVTEDLRREAERRLRPLASQLIFMEVLREEEDNKCFNDCKVKDPTEYPESSFSADEAREDFHARLELLKRLYEPLHVSAAAEQKRNCERRRASGHDKECGDDSRVVHETGSNNSDDDDAAGSRQTDVCISSSERMRHADVSRDADDIQPASAAGTVEKEEKKEEANRGGVDKRRALHHPVHNRDEPRQRSYIQIRFPDVVETHGISGYAASRIVSYAMNLTQAKMQHPIYFTRHGESCYNRENRIGGDPLLTEQGLRDAAALAEFISALKTHLRMLDGNHEQNVQRSSSRSRSRSRSRNAESGDGRTASSVKGGTAASCPVAVDGVVASRHPASASVERAVDRQYINASSGGEGVRYADNLEIWTSQLRRAIQTAELSERLLNIKTLRWSSLNEIHAGVCEDITYAEVSERYPLIDYFRKQSKYTFRYPDGESYQDLVIRLQPVIMELENANRVVVVVAHQAILRCLLAYFGSTSAERSVKMKVPHRTVWRCTYDSKGIASLDELYLDNLDVGF